MLFFRIVDSCAAWSAANDACNFEKPTVMKSVLMESVHSIVVCFFSVLRSCAAQSPDGRCPSWQLKLRGKRFCGCWMPMAVNLLGVVVVRVSSFVIDCQ